jgi:chaperonin GroEL (HSP60 family)
VLKSKFARATDFSSSSDMAQYVFERANISAIRRVRKSDNNRIALAVGATIVNRVEDLRDSDVGTGCGLFNVEKMGDEFVFSILLRPVIYAIYPDISHS